MRKLTLVLLSICSWNSFAVETAAAGSAKVASPPAPPVADTSSVNTADAKFKKKLLEMLDKSDKSLKIIREQIVQNQSAPFLADLYLQLGDLLTEKSTVLYYLQMENEHRTDEKISATKKFSPIVTTAQEAIGIYETILHEFPKFDKREKVLYRLAVSQKSIDESAAFVKTAEQLIKDFPTVKETIQARLLLGQYHYDQQDYEAALAQLNVVKDTTYPLERNAARYRIGLIRIVQEKHADALKMFEAVATDEELKEDLNPAEVSLKAKVAKTNLKREALIDSVRAYTEVYKDTSDPVAYYAKIAPTEALFQETIEKLSFRYIFLKHYNAAIKLLRVLSERVSEPQKVVNIYREVLVGIPVDERLDVPVLEMAFVLDKYNDWSTHNDLSQKLRDETYAFFEKQIRELGTRSHDLAKLAKDPDQKAHLFERARQYYHLYLGFFAKGPQSVKIAVNLADVYYNQRNFFQSASFYLRVNAGEFGPPTHRVDLIQNAILSLQKPADYTYYEQVRAKGMMVSAVTGYMTIDPKMKNDPALSFGLAKAYFEQGYYNRAIKDLFSFMKRFPEARETPDAADLILHYYNTRSDYKGLAKWSESMLALNIPNPKLKAHLEDVHAKAQLRRLDEQVKTQTGFDVTSQGRSYLQTALAISDSGLRSAALQQALGHSKEERDIDTFLKTAIAMAKSEKDAKKRAEIWNSMADEVLAITQFYRAMEIYDRVAADASLDGEVRKSAFAKSVKIAAMLHDPNRMAILVARPMAKKLPIDIQSAIDQQFLSMFESAVQLPEGVQIYLVQRAADDKILLSLFRAQGRMAASARRALVSRVNTQCAQTRSAAICKWVKWPMVSSEIAKFQAQLKQTTPQMQAIEPAATRMSGLLDATKAYEGSGEPRVDVLVTLGNSEIYQAFAAFLQRAATLNKDLAQILNAKAQESLQAAKASRDQCDKIIQAANLQSTNVSRLCGGRGLASVESTLDLAKDMRLQPPERDPKDADVVDKQRSIFAKRDDWKSYFSLAEVYLAHREFHHAAATAMMGRSVFPQSEEEFNAVLGCSLAGTGLKGEARYVLNKASDMNGHKSTCLEQLR